MSTQSGSVTISHRTLVAFAAGVAVALSVLFVFQGTRGSADPSPDETTYVPIAPCRLEDTRPNQNVGTRNTPIGPGETHEQQVSGTNGNCSIPSNATGVSLNATAILATADSHMTIFPFGSALPNASNLNYGPGQPPAVNKVDVKLSDSGAIGVFNLAGEVHFIADVSGYYVTSGLASLQQQLDRSHVWSARFLSDGTKDGTGPYSSSRGNTGAYAVLLDVSRLDLPATAYDEGNFTAVASSTSVCVSAGAYVLDAIEDSSGEIDSLFVVVTTYDADGLPKDCSAAVLITFDDPNQRTISPL